MEFDYTNEASHVSEVAWRHHNTTSGIHFCHKRFWTYTQTVSPVTLRVDLILLAKENVISKYSDIYNVW